MQRFLMLFLLFCSSAQAQLLTGKGAELPLQSIQTPHFDVLHPARLEGFARRVAAAAEKMRSGVIETVGNDPGRTFILVNDETDDFNGFAVPGPYPFIRVFATFPRPTDIGAQWQDAMHALMTHEFAHVAHLSTRDDLRNTLRGIFGAVPGLLEARVPPAWFLEGYAVYLETKFTSGGRAKDSAVRTLRAQMARAGVFPSLSDAGVGVNEDYPFGNTRYVFGAGFVAFLAERFGEATIRQAIALYNLRLSFADAWFELTKQSLGSLWAIWTDLEKTRATKELESLQNSKLETGQRLHLGSGAPAWKTDGSYAFMSGLQVRFVKNGVLEERRIPLPSRPSRLSWDGETLVYSRLVVRGATTYGEVFRLENGIEKQLTQQARARDAIVDGQCIMYVQDYLENSSVRKICGSKDELVYAAPEGWHLFHLAPRGQKLALTVWRPGGFLDIAVLQNNKLELMTSNAAQDQFPTWVSDNRLVFSSDLSGSAQLYQIELNDPTRALRLTAAAGGAYISSQAPNGNLSFSSYTSSGFETRIVSLKSTTSVLLEKNQPQPFDDLSGLEYPVVAYTPLPAPVFWYPATTTGLGATVVGADPAGVFSWQASAGFDVLGGTGWGANFSLNFAPSLEWSANFTAAVDSSGWGIRLSAPWAGRGESQLSGRASYIIRPSIGLVNGTPFVSMFTFLGATQSDDWDYLEYGWGISTSVASSGRFSAAISLADLVSGQPIQLQLSIRGQFSSSPTLQMLLQTHNTFQIRWRTEDGFLSFERITLQSFISLEYSNTLSSTVGVRLLADLIFNYFAPLTFGLELSYGNGFAVRLVTMLPLEQLR